MSARSVAVFQICCDEVLHDDDYGWVVFQTEESAKASVTNVSLVSDEDEWTAVGDLHFCWRDPCQKEAAAAIVEWAARQPVPNVPGQLDLLGDLGAASGEAVDRGR